MKLLKLAAAAVLAAAFLASCTKEPVRILLSDYLDEESAGDAMPAIRRALDDCARLNAAELVLPGDTLRIKAAKAYERYEYISNNTPSMKRIAFLLEGVRDFKVSGNGTTLLFSGHISPFSLEGCRNITVDDLTIDFTRPFVSEGTITAAGKGWFEVRFPDWYKVDLPNGSLQFSDETGETYPFSNMLEFDTEKKEVAYHVHDYWLGAETYPAEKTPEGNYRLYRQDFGDVTIGNTMVFGASSRVNPAFTLLDCEGFLLEDVRLYECCGMGVIAQSSKDIELRKMMVEPTPGSARVVSISADATHFVNCKGYIRLIDCIFKNQKDDATNIHGWYMAVDRKLAPDRLLLRWRNDAQYGIRFIKPGMTLELVDSRTMEQISREKVKSVSWLNSEYAEVAFEAPLPDTVKEGDVAAEDDGYPEVLISGCYIGNNRARGLLINNRGKTVIEKNTFHSAGTAILFEGDGRYWYEQSGVRDVLIKDNVFENCMYGAASWGSAVIAVGSGIPDKEHSRYHKGIVVEDNLFRGFDTRLVNLYCVDGFTFRDNKIERTEDYPPYGDPEKDFVFNHCDNVSVDL